jgi:CAAX protease family protein
MTASLPPPTPQFETGPVPESPDEPAWHLWSAPAAIVLGLGLGVIASIGVEIIGGAAGSSTTHTTPAENIVSNFLFDLGFVAAAIYFASVQGPLRARDFGFRWPGLRTTVVAVLSAGIAYFIVTALYSSLLRLHGSDKLPSDLGVNKSTAALVAASVFVCVIAPIAEEFFFRGFIFGVLRRWRIVVAGRNIGTWVAAVITGILFGLAHTGSASGQYLIPLGFLGFVLCLVRWRTGSLYPCMALHSINNSLALGVNELGWNAPEILGLMAGSLLVIAVVTGPLAARSGPEVATLHRGWFTSTR